MAEKIKLSAYLLNNGYFPTRSKATNAIKEQKVTVNGRIITKDGYLVSEDDVIMVENEESEFVSRAGYKLREALMVFNIDLNDKIVLDIGASTGGFTDCCLQNGARHVYAYDVGHDQIADKLRNDPRVTVEEGVNCRYLRKGDLPETIDFICMDVSFISCTLMLEAISDILDAGKQAVILFKPQFEVGSKYLKGNGVVKSEKEIWDRLVDCQTQATALQLTLSGITPSPIKGKEGNQEYLLLFVKEGKDPIVIKSL